MKANFNFSAIGVLNAVEYPINGVQDVWLINGHHRQQSLLDLGFGDWMVEVKVHLDIHDDAAACDLFLWLNEVAVVDSYDKYEKALRAGRDSAVNITGIADRCGFTIADKSGHGCLRGVAALSRAYKLDEGYSLEAGLNLIAAAWGHAEASCEAKLVEGMATFYKRYEGQFNKPALVKKLAKYAGGPLNLIAEAQTRRAMVSSKVPRRIAQYVADVYNFGRRGGKLNAL